MPGGPEVYIGCVARFPYDPIQIAATGLGVLIVVCFGIRILTAIALSGDLLPRVHKFSCSRRQIVEQRFGLFQIERVEPLGDRVGPIRLPIASMLMEK
jgi:hypothetical protein